MLCSITMRPFLFWFHFCKNKDLYQDAKGFSLGKYIFIHYFYQLNGRSEKSGTAIATKRPSFITNKKIRHNLNNILQPIILMKYHFILISKIAIFEF